MEKQVYMRITDINGNSYPSSVSAYQGQSVSFYAQSEDGNPTSVLWQLTIRLDGGLCPTLGGDADLGTLSTNVPSARAVY
jgi:hypothetical protein